MNLKKKNIIMAIVIIIITSGVSIYATTEYLASANQVSYSNTNTSVNNVGEALNELYRNQKDINNLETQLSTAQNQLSSTQNQLNTLNSNINQTTATASDILSGTSAYTSSGLTNGTFNHIYASGTKLYDSTNGELKIDNLSFRPSTVIIYNTDNTIMLKGNSSGCISTFSSSWFGTAGYVSWSYFTLLNNGFRFYNFDNGFETQTYNWIAIK